MNDDRGVQLGYSGYPMRIETQGKIQTFVGLGAYVALEAPFKKKNCGHGTLEGFGKSEVLQLKQHELKGKSAIAGIMILKKFNAKYYLFLLNFTLLNFNL